MPREIIGYEVRIPTLQPRPASDYDILCMRLWRSPVGSTQRADIERQLLAEGERLGLSPNTAMDDAWSHARTMSEHCHPIYQLPPDLSAGELSMQQPWSLPDPRTNSRGGKESEMKITIEICTNDEWLCQMIGAPETDADISGAYFQAAARAIEAAGAEYTTAQGQRASYHGWNGVQGAMSCGGVLTFDYKGHRGNSDGDANPKVRAMLQAADEAGEKAAREVMEQMKAADLRYAAECDESGETETAAHLRDKWAF